MPNQAHRQKKIRGPFSPATTAQWRHAKSFNATTRLP